MRIVLLTAIAVLIQTVQAKSAEDVLTEERNHKGYFTILALAQNKTFDHFQKKFKDVERVEYLEVSTEQFIPLIMRTAPEITTASIKPHFLKKVRAFRASNNLRSTMVGSSYLQSAEDLFVKVGILLEFLNTIEQRKDLSYFGKSTIRNLNSAIVEVARSTYQGAIERTKKTQFSKALADQMINNFSDIMLSSQVTLSPSEQWINEMEGRDKNYRDKLSPVHEFERNTLGITESIQRRLRIPRISLCETLFLN